MIFTYADDLFIARYSRNKDMIVASKQAEVDNYTEITAQELKTLSL